MLDLLLQRYPALQNESTLALILVVGPLAFPLLFVVIDVIRGKGSRL